MSATSTTHSTLTLDDLQTTVERLVVPRHCEGTYALEAGRDRLFYCTSEEDKSSSYIDFASTNGVDESDLQNLVKACEPAKFGLGDKDVLDESYRKAWKLDRAKFATQFDITESGILATVHDALLHHDKSNWRMEAHLDKLNVYGPQSFFKAHVDTPRDTSMFATLVIVLPTEHKGGDLVLAGKSRWNFDSSAAVSKDSSAQPPRLAFVAFYSDIEHEVTPVESGYRVSITYNLYCFPPLSVSSTSVALRPTPEEENLRNVLKGILGQKQLLPKGGFLGFGLTHKYPVDPRAMNKSTFNGVLKGSDALIERVCKSVGLKLAVKALWKVGYEPTYLLDTVEMKLEGYEEAYEENEQELENQLASLGGIKVGDPDYLPEDLVSNTPVLWVTRPMSVITEKMAYMAYGNEATLGYVYGSLVLAATVPPYNRR